MANVRVRGCPTGASNKTGNTASVASEPHDRTRDSASVMWGRIHTPNHVTMRSWYSV
jgi:hypothetical protein